MARPFVRRWFLVQAVLPALLLAATFGRPTGIGAQPLFKADAPLTVTIATNLRDLLRERDSTELQWHGAELTYTDVDGSTKKVATALRARGHFRRQARNCAFPPLFLRAEREARENSILQGNPRLKIVTPCRPTSAEYQQYIYVEYLMYRTYAIVNEVHHRTRLAKITYTDSLNRVKPIEVVAFFLETEEEVADNNGLEAADQAGAVFEDVVAEPLRRVSLWNYWIGNTDWSVAALHNIELFRNTSGDYITVAYDYDWSGAVNARYSFPNPMLGIRSVRERLHRGPCLSAADWAPTIAHYTSKRAAVDALWSAPFPGLEDRRRLDTKAYLDELWPVLGDPAKFERDVLKKCQNVGN
jgi:hypothetical protein